MSKYLQNYDFSQFSKFQIRTNLWFYTNTDRKKGLQRNTKLSEGTPNVQNVIFSTKLVVRNYNEWRVEWKIQQHSIFNE